MDWGFIFDNYDYIWGYQLDDAYRKYLTEGCDIGAENAGGEILRIRKRPAAQQRPMLTQPGTVAASAQFKAGGQ